MFTVKFLRTYQGINRDVAKSVLSPVTEEETKKAAPKFEADKIPKTPGTESLLLGFMQVTDAVIGFI